jgi:hypothetical protein
MPLFNSCLNKSDKEFQKYMKENNEGDIKITEFHSGDPIENEAVISIIKYVEDSLHENPSEYYIYILLHENNHELTINLEHVSAYRIRYYWEIERKQMCPIIGNISGKGKTITWDSKIKKIVSVGTIQ